MVDLRKPWSHWLYGYESKWEKFVIALEDRYDSDHWTNNLAYWFEDKSREFFCWLAGTHSPVPDQCGIPSHDYCMWCNASTPNQANRIRK